MEDQLRPRVLGEGTDTVARWNAEAYRLRHSDASAALEWAEKAAALARSLGDRAGHGRGLYLSALARFILGRLEGVEATLTQCLEWLDTKGSRSWRADALNLLGNLAFRQGRVDDCRSWYRQALELRFELQDAAGLSAQLNNLALVERHEGRWSEALEALHESVAWAERDPAGGQGNYPLGNLAQLLCDLGLIDEALHAVRRGLAAWADGGDESHRGTLKVLLAVCLAKAGDAASALPHALAGLAIARRTGNRSDEATALRALGRVLSLREDWENSALFLRRSLAIAVQTDDPEAGRDSLAALGENWALRGRWEEARSALLQALGPEKSLNTVAQSDIHRLLARVEEGRGDFETALRHLQAHLGLRDRLRVDGARAKLADLLHRDKLREASDEAERLRALARTDALTGVANRRHLDRRLEEEFERARRFGRPLSLLMVDVDQFKQVNDELSHAVGDRVLRVVASLLKANCRQEDVVGRYGGDEFQVLLIETSEDQARGVAQTLSEALAAYPWSSIDPRLALLGVGIGVAENSGCQAIGDLAAQADEDLYRKKRVRGTVLLASAP